eukprot:503739-Rhodomonas_salina.2
MEALKTKIAFSAPYHPNLNPYIERQNKTFQESLRSFINSRQDDWEDHVPTYEFAYNSSINPSLGDSPFFLSHGRQPRMPVALLHPTKSPAVNDFVEHLHNRIAAARDHLRRTQGVAADRRKDKLVPAQFKVGDLVLLNTEHYNLQLQSLKLTPRFICPLRIEQVRGPNTVVIEVPPRLGRIEPIQNVQHLKPYVTRDPEIGPVRVQQPPDLVDDQEEFEVEDILAHHKEGTKIEYLVRFASYGPEDDLWLPKRNLANAPNVVAAYHVRQTDPSQAPGRRTRRQQAPRHLTRLGHVYQAFPGRQSSKKGGM